MHLKDNTNESNIHNIFQRTKTNIGKSGNQTNAEKCFSFFFMHTDEFQNNFQLRHIRIYV